jgi:hypothetical protein
MKLGFEAAYFTIFLGIVFLIIVLKRFYSKPALFTTNFLSLFIKVSFFLIFPHYDNEANCIVERATENLESMVYEQIDYVTAYRNVLLHDCMVCKRYPTGFGSHGLVCCINKALHGLRQSAYICDGPESCQNRACQAL